MSLINNNPVTGGVDNGYQGPTPYGVPWGIGNGLAGLFSSGDQPETSGTSVKPISNGNSGWSLGSWLYDVTHPSDGTLTTTTPPVNVMPAAGGATGSF